MKIIITIFLTTFSLFGFNYNKAKNIIDKNNTKEILQNLKSPDGLYFLETAIKLNRIDILKLAIKNHFDFTQTSERHHNTILDFSVFMLKKDAVKILVKFVNPNHISTQHKNSIKMLLTGIYQQYRWILYPKEKLIKILKDDKLSKADIQKNLKLYKQLRKDSLDIIDILKTNGAKFEETGTYPNEITLFLDARKGHIKKDSYKYRLFEKLLGDKGKLFLYIGMNQFNKAKNFLDSHINILKEPYFLDYPHHYFYVLQKDKKYCNIVKFMIQKSFQNHFNIIDYYVTNNHSNIEVGGSYTANCFKKLYDKYDPKPKYNFKIYDIFKFIKNHDYANIKKYISDGGWNYTAFTYFIPIKYQAYSYVIQDHPTPFLEALLGRNRDKKIVDIMLKNGGYMSGWNEIDYNILENKPLHLEKYSKWVRIFKLNQGDLSKNITSIYLAVLDDNFNLMKKLIKYGANPNIKLSNGINLIDFAINYNANKKIIEYLIKLKKNITISQIQDLANSKRFIILKFIKDNNIKPEYTSFNNAIKETLKKLEHTKNHLIPTQSKSYNDNVVKPFEKLFNLRENQ